MKKAMLVGLVAVPAAALALTVAGRTYEPAVTVDDQPLKLIGAGIREKWFMEVYALAAYTASGDCSVPTIVTADEPKYLRLDMLRDVSADRMGSTIGGSFDKHMPKDASPELRQQRQTFQSYFKEEFKKGGVLEFLYVPGTGTILKQNGRPLGAPLVGPQFSRVLWDIYFGGDSCCEDLKRSILRTCGK